MIVGIGVDSTSIEETARYLNDLPEYERKTFTLAELGAAPASPARRAEWLAVRFAAKEAVFKALSNAAEACDFDLRHVETLNREDGAPYVNVTDELARVMELAGATHLHISATTECGLATVFVVAESRER